MLVDRYVAPLSPVLGEVPSFWNTELWNLCADEAGPWETHINQGDLGHVAEKPATLGNNYGHLQQLETELESSWDSRPSQGGSRALALLQSLNVGRRLTQVRLLISLCGHQASPVTSLLSVH